LSTAEARTTVTTITPAKSTSVMQGDSRAADRPAAFDHTPFDDDGVHIAELEDQDPRRMAELVEAYMDLPLGIVDAAEIALAERLRLIQIATLNHRHFIVVRPSHTAAFVLLPGSDAS
jgi:uncharacterized protein